MPDSCCTQEMLLPYDAIPNAMACTLSAEGQLVIQAPRLAQERLVPICCVDKSVGKGKWVEDGKEVPVEKDLVLVMYNLNK
ncbi:UNVERIFIED_CONTAM: hypothetical protein K2H54_073979 [Gekko kuhli]